jgi:hypothetical protein
MNVSVIHGRSHFRLVNGSQGNSGMRNGSRIFHANHAVIMNEVRCILQVVQQIVEVQRLTNYVGKLRACGMVQGTAHLGKSSCEIEYFHLTDTARILVRAGESSFGCLSGFACSFFGCRQGNGWSSPLN